jgi:uncharacterized protein YbjT (DUF2867 family)
VLVAGATGYLGRFVTQGLKARGCFVRVLARSPEKLDRVQGLPDEIVKAEVTRPETLAQPMPPQRAVQGFPAGPLAQGGST